MNNDTHISGTQFTLLFLAVALSFAGGIYVGYKTKKPIIGILLAIIIIAASSYGINKLPRIPNIHTS